MNTRKFYGMNTQERDAFFANEQLKDFLSEVRTAIKEKRAITNAGLTIPSVVLPLLKEAIAANSKLLKYVRVQHVSGTSRQTIMGDVPEGIWTEMCATLNELTLAFNGVEVDGYKVGGYFAICNALVEDSDEDLVQEIIEKLGQAIGLALDKAIVYGKGTKMPLGFVTRLAQSAAPSNYPATARAWKDLSKTNIITGTGKSGLALLKELVLNTKVVNTKYSKTGIVWIMNRSTHITLLAESMDKNLNAVIVAGMNNEMPVVGGAIEELDFMEDGDIAFGYMDNYLLAERAGTAIGQSEHAKFIEDQMVLKGTARYDGTPAIAEAFALMSIGTTAPKTTVDFAADKANAA